MTILDKRITYKPTEYPHAEEFWEMQQRSHWLWDECKLAQDTYEWDTKLTEIEKTVISKILKGFTQVELIVEDYWSKKVAKWFPKREIVDMAITFGSFECFDKETELLTSKGWVKCPDINIGHEIAQYNIDSKEVSFVLPKKVVSYDYDGFLHHYVNGDTDICVTPNHDLILVNPYTQEVIKRKSFENKEWFHANYPSSGMGIGGADYNSGYPNSGRSGVGDDDYKSGQRLTSIEKVLIVAATQGCLTGISPFKNRIGDSNCSFYLTDTNKIDKLVEMLDDTLLTYTRVRNQISVNIPIEINLNSVKSLEFLNLKYLSVNKAKEIINELCYWSNDTSNAKVYYSGNELAIDKVQAISCLANLNCTRSIGKETLKTFGFSIPFCNVVKSTKECYFLTFTNKTTKIYPKKNKIEYKDKIYCVSVNTENLVSRRNGKVAFTGNTIHAKAYNMLSETLGIDDFSEFLQDPIIMEKFNKLYETNDNNTSDIEHKAFSLAIFSAFTEGVCLYSSFAVLQSFKLRGLLGGVSKIVEFSIRDENVHSVAGCWLFNTLLAEYPELRKSKTLEDKIYKAAEFIIQIETKFMDHVLEESIENVNKDDIKNFIIERTNQKLIEIGYEPKFQYDKESARRIGEWFYRLNKGIVQQDFFAALESNYSKGAVIFEDDTIDWDF